jgi:DNA repair exonuclease SbcCD ATPase subunit
MTNNNGKYNFLKIEKVIIRNFSLFPKNNSVVNEVINEGVYCLAGANGLGKTTFLNIINYGLTGLVLKPNKEVFSPSEIEKYNKDYTNRYFEGRIKAKDKNEAEVEIHFLIDSIHYRIIRDFNNREGLILFEAYKIENGRKISIIQTLKHSPIELNQEYQKAITEAIGIGKFEYFIFFQLYVLTFDENRRMLFWDARALTSALSIAFNYDLSDTDKIIELKRKMEKLESDAKNARWQAKQVKDKIKSLLETKKEKEKNNWGELKKYYDDLSLKVQEKEKTYRNIEIEYDTFLKRQNIINSEILQLKTKYKKLFSQYSEPRSKLLNNQYVIYSKKENKCFLCSSSGHYVLQNIEKNLHQNKCPVCSTTINDENDSNQDNLLKQLAQIDNEIDSKTKELENLIFETEAKKVELEKAEFEYYSARELFNEFEKENSNLDFGKTGNRPIDDLIEEYKKQFERSDKETKDYYKQRDKIRPEFDNLLAKVNSAYKEAEEYFVPLVKKFSKSFIGLDLNIFFKQKGKDISLYFELQGIPRTESFQLSESQRFFLDIALRMALAVYLSKNDNESTLLIDTPEGSLDIAYESRVGIMFAEFVVEYDQSIIMTANINASQLLISLAEKCGDQKMKFRRMLDWTDLTEIQKEGEHLFEKVYKNIELSLKGKNHE